MEKKLPLIRFVKADVIILSCILLVALIFRLYKINTPLADFHSWRQSDTAAVSRNFVKYGFDVLHPKYNDLSNIQSGLDNPHGYRFVEFPVYNVLMAAAYEVYPAIPIEIYGRIISIIFSLLLIAVIYYLLLSEYSRTAAIVAALIYAIFPFFVFFSRVVLPDIMATSLAFIAIFLLYKFATHHQRVAISYLYFILSMLSFTTALLVKPTVIFYGLPLLYLLIQSNGLNWKKNINVLVYFFLSALPLLIWRKYIQQYPEGIPSNIWLITSVNTYEGVKVVFLKPAFFRWVFFERINNIIFGGYAAIFFLLGLIAKTRRLLLFGIFIAGFAYLLVFEGGNVQHEYYQIIILPMLAIAAGVGTALLLQHKNIFQKDFLTYTLIAGIFAFSLFISYYHVKDYYNYSVDLVNTAKIIDTFTQPNDKIVTDSTGDTTLLYLADRRGSPAVYRDLEELKKEGYLYFVTFSRDVANSTEEKYGLKPVFGDDKFTLFRL